MTYWLFRDLLSGGNALFNTKREAKNFLRQVNIRLLQNPLIGEGLTKEEYRIEKVELNPDVDEWLYN